MFFRGTKRSDTAAQEDQAIKTALDRVQAIISFDLDGTVLDANANFLAALGYGLDEIQGKHHSMFVDPDYAASADYRAHWDRLGRGEFVTGEFKRVAKGGREVWIEASYNPVLDADGTPVKVVKFAIDITERKMAAVNAAGQLDAISKSQAVIEFDLDGTIRTANDNFLTTLGYTLDEIKGQHHRMFIEPEVAAGPDYAAFWADLAAGEFQAGEFKRIGKGGREVWIQASYNPILDPDGRPYKVVKYATDVTATKLKAVEAAGQLDAISKVQAVIEFDLDGTIRTANDNFLTTLGYTLDEIRGRHHSMFVDKAETESPEYGAFWKALAAGEFQAAAYKRIGKGGREVWIQASYNPILDPDGRPYKVVKYATDITERRRAVQEIDKGLAALSKGDLTARLPDTLTGDFTELREAFNGTVGRLEELVGGILEAAANIADETGAIASSASDLSSRGEKQAATVEETSAAMEEIAASVKNTAASAETATNAAKDASRHAENGGSVVSDAVAAMARIEESSDQIRKITDVIDDIAFQTNLLALNAGVEAARAGDAGKGFAVVATEVRALAQRASDSAREIKTLIETSGKEVAEGSRLVNHSGEALTEIVSAVRSVDDSITEISTSSQEQASGITQVTEAVANIDSTTQHTAAIAEESAAAATQLAERARNLRELVSFFQQSGAAAGSNVAPMHRAPAAPAQNPAGAKRAVAGATALAEAPEDEGWSDF